MDEREKLFELLKNVSAKCQTTGGVTWWDFADHLIANGVTFKEQEAKEPLTIEELKQMNGEPVWLPEENAWGIINIDEDGQWAGKPFVTFYYKSVECNYDIQKRKTKCYRHKPKEEKK